MTVLVRNEGREMTGEFKKILKKLFCAGIVALALAGTKEARATCVNSNSVVKGDIEYYMQTNKSVYSLGENVKMLYRLTNLSHSNSVKFEFSNLQQWSFEVRDGTTTIWWWPKMINPALSQFTLYPGDVKGYFKEWDMMNDNTGTIVTPGTYDVIGALLSVRDLEKYVPVSVQIEIVEGPYCGDADHPYPGGDLSGPDGFPDCRVDFYDFALLANNWLRSSLVKSVFDFGVATKGPLHLAGNIELEGVNVSVESDVYIVSENSNMALEMIGNSHISGDVFIVNPFGTVNIQGGDASIGGETVPEALDHVFTGIDPVEFPVPNPSYFEHYVVEDINYPSGETTFENIRIPPNTNPTFPWGVTMTGIVYIETPNIVTFTGSVTITGIIIGNGNINDDSGTNRIDFLGPVDSSPVTELPPQFGGLRDETGTFIIAPGFSLSFGGAFATINGAIAANGIQFYGNAGGTIDGPVLNYSDTPMELSGNSDLFVNRSNTAQIPAGFD